MLQAVNAYLIARATREDAYEAAHWMIGSVNGRGWEHVWPVAAALAVLVPAALAMARPLALLEMGDDAARSLGVTPGLIPAAITGALLLVASDLAAQRLLSIDLPVGVLTGALGGLYLGWLLRSGWRRT